MSTDPAPEGDGSGASGTGASGTGGVPTILGGMSVVLGEDKACGWLAAKAVQLDGVFVTDPATPAPTGAAGARWMLNPP